MDTNERGSGRIQKPPREELKVSAKVGSPDCFLLQYKRKWLSVIVNRECPIIGRIVDELEYRLPEEVMRPDFAAIDYDDED